MKKNLLFFLCFGFLVLTLSECKTTKSTSTTATTSKAVPYLPTDEIAKAHGAALADLNNGRELFIGSCDKCHKLPNPTKHDLSGWQNTMKAMAPKAHLSNSDAEMVIKYLAAAQ